MVSSYQEVTVQTVVDGVVIDSSVENRVVYISKGKPFIKVLGGKIPVVDGIARYEGRSPTVAEAHRLLPGYSQCPGCPVQLPENDLQQQARHMVDEHPDIVQQRQRESARWNGWEQD